MKLKPVFEQEFDLWPHNYKVNILDEWKNTFSTSDPAYSTRVVYLRETLFSVASDENRFLFLDAGERIVACASVLIIKNKALLCMLAVSPKQFHAKIKGTGSQVIQYLINFLRSQNVSELAVSSFEDVVPFYTKNGFSVTAQLNSIYTLTLNL
jgi:N-acetylglutamate synthase-like GNAT family acetyltransferase